MDPATLSLSRQQIPLGTFQTPRLAARAASSSLRQSQSHSLASRSKPLVVRRENEGALNGFSKTLVEGPSSFAAAVAAPAKTPETVVQSGNGAGAEAVEVSYVMIKPDGVQRGLVGEIISRFERKGFVLKGLKLFKCPQELAEEHYKDLSSKPFYPKLVEYIISGPVVAMAWEGKGVVLSARKLIGATNPLTAEPGTIRGDFAVDVGRNVVHGSDSVENGAREIGLWFKEGELVEWEPITTPWLRE